jgi:CYTH domain-containing protein
MAFEIERKFLVVGNAWKSGVTARDRFRDGLIASPEGGKVRVRVSDRGSWLTVKGKRVGISRLEFEYPIPRADAEAMLKNLCTGPVLEKTRNWVPYRGVPWSVDVYHGELEGLVVAEVELDAESQTVPLPPWIGQEITGNARLQQASRLVPARGAEEMAGARGPIIPKPKLSQSVRRFLESRTVTQAEVA